MYKVLLFFFLLLQFGISFAQSLRPITALGYSNGVYSAKKRLYYAFEADYLKPSQIKIIDDAFGKLVKTVKTDSIPYAPVLSSDERFIYFVSQYPHKINRLDLDSYAVETVLVLPDSIGGLQGLQTLPGNPNRFMITWAGPVGSGISLYEGSKLLAISKPAFYANNQLLLQNDSTFFVFTDQQQVLARGRVIQNTIKLLDTFPEWSTNLLGFQVGLIGDTLYSANGQVLKIEKDSLRLIKQIKEGDQFQFGEYLAVDKDLAYWYLVKDEFFNYKITKIGKKDLEIDTIWKLTKPLPNSFDHAYIKLLHEDAFIFSNQFTTHLYRQCTSNVPMAMIKEGAALFACLPNDSIATLNVAHKVPEYLWSTGATTSAVQVSETAIFSVKYGDTTGCLTPPSEATTVYFISPRHHPRVNYTSSSFNVQICRKQSVELFAEDFNVQSYEWSNGATTSNIRVTESGTFRVRSIDNSGCPSIWSFPIVVEQIPDTIPQKPVIQSTKGTFSFCTGEVAELFLPPGYNYYLWQGQKTSSPTWRLSAPGSISVRVGNDPRCLSEWANPVEVKFYPVPKQPVIQRIGAILATSNADETHTWYRNNQELQGETGQFLTITQNGEYLVRTRANGCVSPFSSGFIVQDLVTATRDRQNPKAVISIFPNPADQWLSVQAEGSFLQGNYQIVGLDGKVLQDGILVAPERIQLDRLPSGIYVLNFFNRHSFQSVRFIKM